MAASSEVGSRLLAWIMTGVGTLLAYSAYKGRPPWDVLRDVPGTTFGKWDVATGVALSGTVDATPSSSFSSSVPRIRMIANRETPPALVPIRPHGMLDKDAAASLERVFDAVGYTIPNVGSYRSFGEQAAARARGEVMSDGAPRFADPNKSLHVVGLAIDLRADYAARPMVQAAMRAEGWQQVRPAAEPWHWSYLVRG